MEKEINTKLLRWYKKNKRILPWRVLDLNNLPIPYYIFVSEYMLQQTTVQTVIKKFNEFITIWPKIDNLASSNEEKILNFWSGLGYYSRARNLLKAAKKLKKILMELFQIIIKISLICQELVNIQLKLF